MAVSIELSDFRRVCNIDEPRKWRRIRLSIERAMALLLNHTAEIVQYFFVPVQIRQESAAAQQHDHTNRRQYLRGQSQQRRAMRKRLIVPARTVHNAIAPNRRIHAHVQLGTAVRTIRQHCGRSRSGSNAAAHIDRTAAAIQAHERPARFHFQPPEHVILVVRIDKLHGDGTRPERLLELMATLPAGAEHLDDIVARRIRTERTSRHRCAIGIGQDDACFRFAQISEMRADVVVGTRSLR